MAKFCTNCGATLPDDKNFCTECGTPVAIEEPVQQTPLHLHISIKILYLQVKRYRQKEANMTQLQQVVT